MSQLSRSVLRTLTSLVASVGLLLCASTVEATTFTKLDRLRILNQNMANKPSPFQADVGPCHDDNRCRARHIAQRILEGDYDVVIMEEEFDEDSMQELIAYLGHTFPYYIGQFDGEPIGKPWIDRWKHQIEVASLLLPLPVQPELIAAAEWAASLATTNSQGFRPAHIPQWRPAAAGQANATRRSVVGTRTWSSEAGSRGSAFARGREPVGAIPLLRSNSVVASAVE